MKTHPADRPTPLTLPRKQSVSERPTVDKMLRREDSPRTPLTVKQQEPPR